MLEPWLRLVHKRCRVFLWGFWGLVPLRVRVFRLRALWGLRGFETIRF